MRKSPIHKTYTCDPTEFGYLDKPKNWFRVPMHYVLKNNEEHNLGKTPLQFGKVRIFQDDGRGTTAFMGEDWGNYTPLDDEMRLYIGTAQDVVVVRTIEKNERTISVVATLARAWNFRRLATAATVELDTCFLHVAYDVSATHLSFRRTAPLPSLP